MAKANAPWNPTRQEIRRECLKIQAEWSERERYERAGFNYFLAKEVYFGDPVRVGAGGGESSTTGGD